MAATTEQHHADIGALIKSTRTRWGLTIEVAAKSAELAYATWWRVEKGDDSISAATLSKVAAVFHVPPDVLKNAWFDPLRIAELRAALEREAPPTAFPDPATLDDDELVELIDAFHDELYRRYRTRTDRLNALLLADEMRAAPRQSRRRSDAGTRPTHHTHAQKDD